MSRNIIFFLIILLGLSSCKNQFDRAPGTLYEEVPDALRGNYISVNKSQKDTFKFEVKKYFIVNKSQNENVDSLAIHKDFEISSFDKYLFFSVKDEGRIYQIAKVNMEQDYLELSSIFAENLEDNKKLPKYFSHKDFVQNGDTITVYQMNELALLKYFKKHVKKKNAQRIYKVK